MLEADAKMSAMPPSRFAALTLTMGGSCDAMTLYSIKDLGSAGG